MTIQEQNIQDTQNTSDQKSLDFSGNSAKLSGVRIKDLQDQYTKASEELKKLKAQYKKMKDAGIKE